MTESIENAILSKIKKAKRGTVFFTTNFLSFGSTDAIRKALQRLVNKGEIDRVALGMYTRPEISKRFGKLATSIESIARAIARRDRVTIIPTGDYALNKLGLSTQVPLNVVFISSGMPRKIKMGKTTILFIRASPKHTATVGPLSSLAIQAMRVIGKDKITKEEIKRIQEVLSKEKKTKLLHDMALAPEWMRIIIRPVLNKMNNV